jgi:hypothetical protein
VAAGEQEHRQLEAGNLGDRVERVEPGPEPLERALEAGEEAQARRERVLAAEQCGRQGLARAAGGVDAAAIRREPAALDAELLWGRVGRVDERELDQRLRVAAAARLLDHEPVGEFLVAAPGHHLPEADVGGEQVGPLLHGERADHDSLPRERREVGARA